MTLLYVVGTIIGIAVSVILAMEIAALMFPCASYGPVLHRNYTEPNCEGADLKCKRCGTKWMMVDKVYSILSDGDPTSYIPIWERI